MVHEEAWSSCVQCPLWHLGQVPLMLLMKRASPPPSPRGPLSWTRHIREATPPSPLPSGGSTFGRWSAVRGGVPRWSGFSTGADSARAQEARGKASHMCVAWGGVMPREEAEVHDIASRHFVLSARSASLLFGLSGRPSQGPPKIRPSRRPAPSRHHLPPCPAAPEFTRPVPHIPSAQWSHRACPPAPAMERKAPALTRAPAPAASTNATVVAATHSTPI